MATKKDLVEAYQFSRRRLVTAFVSGAPGGREVEPARPGRTIVGGLALAVLLIAGAAIAGVFSPRDPSDWKDVGLVVSKETGAAYVITEKSDKPLLRPVINITSAKLILGGSLSPAVVSQDTIDDQVIGDAIGILDAPADLPSTDLLIDEGWTACTGPGQGTQVNLAEKPAVEPMPRAGFVVRSETSGEFYVIAESRPDLATGEPTRAYRYQLPRGVADTMLNDLGLPVRQDALEVSEGWLALFPTGGDLAFDSFALGSLGRPVDAPGLPKGAGVGDLVPTEAGAYLLTAEGPTRLDEFALAVYRGTMPDQVREFPTQQRGPGGRQATAPYADAHWPETRLEPVYGEHCALLDPQRDGVPLVHVAGNPSGSASSADVPDKEVARSVEPGRGAHVIAGSWADADQGTPFVVDAKGLAYPLVEDAGDLLGYGGHDVRVVPDAWIELFGTGVALSQDAALRPPRQQGRR